MLLLAIVDMIPIIINSSALKVKPKPSSFYEDTYSDI